MNQISTDTINQFYNIKKQKKLKREDGEKIVLVQLKHKFGAGEKKYLVASISK